MVSLEIELFLDWAFVRRCLCYCGCIVLHLLYVSLLKCVQMVLVFSWFLFRLVFRVVLIFAPSLLVFRYFPRSLSSSSDLGLAELCFCRGVLFPSSGINACSRCSIIFGGSGRVFVSSPLVLLLDILPGCFYLRFRSLFLRSHWCPVFCPFLV